MSDIDAVRARLAKKRKKRESLYADLDKSLDLNALPYDVFKYGTISTGWEVKVLGEWQKDAIDRKWSNERLPKRARISRGNVDIIYIPLHEMPQSSIPQHINNRRPSFNRSK